MIQTMLSFSLPPSFSLVARHCLLLSLFPDFYCLFTVSSLLEGILPLLSCTDCNFFPSWHFAKIYWRLAFCQCIIHYGILPWHKEALQPRLIWYSLQCVDRGLYCRQLRYRHLHCFWIGWHFAILLSQEWIFGILPNQWFSRLCYSKDMIPLVGSSLLLYRCLSCRKLPY